MPSPTTAGVLGMARTRDSRVPEQRLQPVRSDARPGWRSAGSRAASGVAQRGRAPGRRRSAFHTQQVRSSRARAAWMSGFAAMPSAWEAASQWPSDSYRRPTRGRARFSLREEESAEQGRPITPAPMTPSVAPSPITVRAGYVLAFSTWRLPRSLKVTQKRVALRRQGEACRDPTSLAADTS